ncbi:MAG: hypothetical protein J0G32_05455 [Alphaproteobacteria bacterium]|nr:hypothetical protein [Alphaproteobacteria bacterium]OJV13897.1 MAG: hypothetical protein BGO27_08380 [Alphaproteobacteria bacterium 33-17]
MPNPDNSFNKRYDNAIIVSDKYLQQPMQEHDFEKIKKDLEDKVSTCITNGAYLEACYLLDCLYDANRSIYRETSEDGTIEIRDATQAIPIEQQNEGNSPARLQILKGMMAAIDVSKLELDSEKAVPLSLKIRDLCLLVENEMRKLENQATTVELHKLVEETRGSIVKALNDAGVEEAMQKFNIALQYQNFKDKQRDIIHVSSLETESGTFKISEIMVGIREQTAKQIDFHESNWFRKLSEFEQKIYRIHHPAIVSGAIKPTQLRSIPGIPNAYSHLVRSYLNKDTPENLTKIYHAGTLVSLSPNYDVRFEISDLNHEQLKQHAGNQEIVVNTLVNPKIVDSEKDIVAISAIHSKKHGISYSNTSTNLFRAVGGNDTAAIDENLKTIASIISGIEPQNEEERKTLEKTKKYLEGKRSPIQIILSVIPILSLIVKYISNKQAEKLGKALSNIAIDEDSKEVLHSAIKTRNSFNNLKFGSVIGNMRQNYNLDLSKEYTSLAHKQGKLQMITCKSGKDRTGQAVFSFIKKEVDEYCKKKDVKIELAQISSDIGKTDSMGYMPGGIVAGGGTAGSYGVKPLIFSIQPNDRKEVNKMIRTTAKSNLIAKNAVKNAPQMSSLENRLKFKSK